MHVNEVIITGLETVAIREYLDRKFLELKLGTDSLSQKVLDDARVEMELTMLGKKWREEPIPEHVDAIHKKYPNYFAEAAKIYKEPYRASEVFMSHHGLREMP